ncbi:MAG: AAA family ATPase [Panacagrimonas sp.]
MLSKIVPVKNVARLNDAGEALRRRPAGMPGMGLVHGETGYGKTTAVTWYANRCNAVYVRALACWTPAAMLTAIARDLRIQPRGSCAAMMHDIIEALSLSNRPLFVDEADYLIDSKRMTESLRDLHDMTTVPVVLIGMGGIDQRLSHRKQLTGRVMQDVQFQPLDLEDARTLASTLCEVRVADDLLERLHRQAGGSARLLVVGLARIEQRAKSQGAAEISAAAWGKADSFFTGDAPVAAAAGLRAVK